MKILVTGGAGFIGSHLCERLISLGHTVIAIDDLSTGNRRNLITLEKNLNFKLVEISILDKEQLRKNSIGVEYVFHLAAAVGVFNIMQRPLQSLFTNIRGTENILEVALESNIPVFITSSSEIYGKNNSDSLRESDDRVLGSPLALRWSYSEAKAIDESMAYAYFTEKKLETRIVRFFNTVGPRQLGAYGMVVPRFIKSALEHKPITIYGTGNQTRCFAHVYDVIDAVVAVAFSNETIGKVVNIGNKQEISILDLANEIIKFTDSKSPIVFMDYSEAYGPGFEDMDRRVPNIDLINNLVGWKPQRNLSKIIEDICAELKTQL
jgi:UDP-glucose 4-epimerase